MSESIRQSNLFSSEDYKKVFKAYSFIDYSAYDFDSLKQALLNYIQTYYPEDFNDYIESSEFIAIVELLAYFGTSLAFRTDLNSRENFIDTAERRESIIRLAQMVNYVPRRNIAANGLFKIAAVQTNQPLTDSNGVSINDSAIFWNDANNPDWFDQFVLICNAAFSTLNPFGRPTKSGNIGGIPTDLYELNNILKLNVAYPITLNINGQQYPVDICNPDFVTNESIFERHPDPANSFNFVYRNDSLGVGSSNTGFFLYFRQGSLLNVDTNFEFPVPNRVYPIQISNINQTDVYVQETDESGNVISKWTKVPALAGENIIYNSIKFSERNIFDVISGANDTISLRFADGNFGNVPTGLFRTWVRTSANQALVIRPDDARGLQINIPYVGVDQQEYTLRIVFSLEQTIGNAAPAETDDQIKQRAPEVFSTQSRMVNGSDYNVLPLVYANQIAKIQATNRTYSGNSRYLDLVDPTGFHKDLLIFGQDGALYRDNKNIETQLFENSTNSNDIETIVAEAIQEALKDSKVSNFFYDEYIPGFESSVRVNVNDPGDPSGPRSTGYSILDLNNPNQTPLYWKTTPYKFKNDTGYFANGRASDASAVSLVNTFTTSNVSGGTYQPWGFINSGAVVEFAAENGTIPYSYIPTTKNSAPIRSVSQSGVPLNVDPYNPFAGLGPVELGVEEQLNYKAIRLYPYFRNELNDSETAALLSALSTTTSFWLYYDILRDEWGISTLDIVSTATDLRFEYPSPVSGNIYTSPATWRSSSRYGMLYVNIASDSQTGQRVYTVTARGRVYVFESYKNVRFFWEPNKVIIDNSTGLALKDNIQIMPMVNTTSLVDNNDPVIPDPPTGCFLTKELSFNITGVYTQADGHQDTAKVEVSLVDENNDGISDDPSGFSRLVNKTDRVVFEYYTDEINGYQSTRPWISKWDKALGNYSGPLYVYFPMSSNTSTVLFGSPFIANVQFDPDTDTSYIQDPGSYTGSGYRYVSLDSADLIFLNNMEQIVFDVNFIDPFQSISNQLTSFFNNQGDAFYPWLKYTNLLDNKREILENYFFAKSYLLTENSDPGYGNYYLFQLEVNGAFSENYAVTNAPDPFHYDRNGKSFTQNTNIIADERFPLHFRWSHYAPVDQRIDPSPTNIVDMIVITDSYYRDVTIWKNSNGSIESMPVPPTTEELRIQFQDLETYKMVSDALIWNSGKFKVLFGQQALPELQATFKVVKSGSTNVSDNEVKTRVVKAIDTYFDIRNWDFGEKFYYTELAAFIHQQLSKIISSVVIVPLNASSQFGNLFEISASPSELFISTATVNNVSIVAGLTDSNLRL